MLVRYCSLAFESMELGETNVAMRNERTHPKLCRLRQTQPKGVEGFLKIRRVSRQLDFAEYVDAQGKVAPLSISAGPL